jgi:hypothetical protein
MEWGNNRENITKDLYPFLLQWYYSSNHADDIP